MKCKIKVVALGAIGLCVGCAVLWWIMQLFGTPWGYVGFYHRASKYLQQYFEEHIEMKSMHFDCKSKLYWGEFTLAQHSDIRYQVYEYGPYGEEKVFLNNYYACLWSAELNNCFHDNYPLLKPDISVSFDKRSALVFHDARSIPSVFDLEERGLTLPCLYISFPQIVETGTQEHMQSVYCLLLEIREAFPHTSIKIKTNDAWIEFKWFEQTHLASYEQYISYICQETNVVPK